MNNIEILKVASELLEMSKGKFDKDSFHLNSFAFRLRRAVVDKTQENKIENID